MKSLDYLISYATKIAEQATIDLKLSDDQEEQIFTELMKILEDLFPEADFNYN